MLSSQLTSLLLIALIVYMIVRQFMERPVMSLASWALPILIIYYSYTNIMSEFAHPIVNALILLVPMLIGFVLGCLIGIFRSSKAHMRLDPVKGIVLAKASTVGICIWLGLILLKVATGYMLYRGLTQVSILAALGIALVTALFLGNILAGQGYLYLRATRRQFPMPLATSINTGALQ